MQYRFGSDQKVGLDLTLARALQPSLLIRAPPTRQHRRLPSAPAHHAHQPSLGT